MSANLVTENVVAFLKQIPPFQFLPVYELSSLASGMSLEYFPRDQVILRAGEAAADVLYIVQKGAVRLALRTAVGKELTLDVRSEGEIFGLLSVMGRAEVKPPRNSRVPPPNVRVPLPRLLSALTASVPPLIVVLL